MPESLFNKIAGLKPATLLKKRLLHRSTFPVNFAKFPRTPFYRTTPGVKSSPEKRLQDMSSRQLQRNNFSSSKTSSRCLNDIFARRIEDVLEDETLLR